MANLYKLLLSHPAHLISFGFGSGLSPIAPGTFGSLAALPFVWLLWQIQIIPAVLLMLVAFIVGVRCTTFTANALGVQDPGSIVWDEFVGIFVAAIPYWMVQSPNQP